MSWRVHLDDVCHIRRRRRRQHTSPPPPPPHLSSPTITSPPTGSRAPSVANAQPLTVTRGLPPPRARHLHAHAPQIPHPHICSQLVRPYLKLQPKRSFMSPFFSSFFTCSYTHQGDYSAVVWPRQELQRSSSPYRNAAAAPSPRPDSLASSRASSPRFDRQGRRFFAHACTHSLQQCQCTRRRAVAGCNE